MTLFWNRQNKPIEDTLDWARKFEDVAYRQIALDQDDPVTGTPMVSTIWNGLDRAVNLHADDDTAMIFETAYLEGGRVLETWLDHSEEQALTRHRLVCLSMLGREPRPDDGLVQLIIKQEREQRE